MIKHNQNGEANGLVISFIFVIVLLIAALGVAGWAISGRQDYKNNVDQKVTVAVTQAVKDEDIAKDKQFTEEYKKPLDTYRGPEAYGSLVFEYPKTWSGYVDDSGSSSSPVDGYFAPGVVPSISKPESSFALRVQVQNQPYDQLLKTYSSMQKSGKVKISAYALPKMPKTVGSRVVGQLSNKKTVDLILLPLRSQTVLIWTEGGSNTSDFNNSILPNFSFSP